MMKCGHDILKKIAYCISLKNVKQVWNKWINNDRIFILGFFILNYCFKLLRSSILWAQKKTCTLSSRPCICYIITIYIYLTICYCWTELLHPSFSLWKREACTVCFLCISTEALSLFPWSKLNCKHIYRRVNGKLRRSAQNGYHQTSAVTLFFTI